MKKVVCLEIELPGEKERISVDFSFHGLTLREQKRVCEIDRFLNENRDRLTPGLSLDIVLNRLLVKTNGNYNS